MDKLLSPNMGISAKIFVSVGQLVEIDEIIGAVGKTGRATGPHLHWGVCLNNNMIDPKLVMR